MHHCRLSLHPQHPTLSLDTVAPMNDLFQLGVQDTEKQIPSFYGRTVTLGWGWGHKLSVGTRCILMENLS